jgi:hypothetical protein
VVSSLQKQIPLQKPSDIISKARRSWLLRRIISLRTSEGIGPPRNTDWYHKPFVDSLPCSESRRPNLRLPWLSDKISVRVATNGVRLKRCGGSSKYFCVYSTNSFIRGAGSLAGLRARHTSMNRAFKSKFLNNKKLVLKEWNVSAAQEQEARRQSAV